MPKTKSQVLADRGPPYWSCCDRYMDGLTCYCLENATPDERKPMTMTEREVFNLVIGQSISAIVPYSGEFIITMQNSTKVLIKGTITYCNGKKVVPKPTREMVLAKLTAEEREVLGV